MAKKQPELFISYSRSDDEYVKSLMLELEAQAVPYWSDQKIEAGTLWITEIESAIKRASVFVLVISQNFEKSDYALFEAGIAVGRAKESGALVVPLIRPGASIPSVLRGYQAIRTESMRVEEVVTRLRTCLETASTKTEPILRELSLFVSSPADVTAEREVISRVVEELNATVASSNGIILRRYTWERFAPVEIGHPQSVMNEMIRDIDVFILILGNRLGTPVGIGGGSGTEVEFQIVAERWRHTGHPQILCYLKATTPKIESSTEIEQQRKVLAFRDQLKNEGFVFEFTSMEDLERAVRLHFVKIIESAGRRPTIG